jgi:choline dehydrogenase-like flavoprotein
MLFKLIKEAPLAVPEALRLLRLLQNYFIVLGIHHRDDPTDRKCLFWKRERELTVSYERCDLEEEERWCREKKLLRLLPMLGALPLKRIDPGPGSSIHYGGTLPMQDEEKRWTTTPQGQLRGSRSVFVVDGSLFPSLPAKGLTFTLMANARRIASRLASAKGAASNFSGY